MTCARCGDRRRRSARPAALRLLRRGLPRECAGWRGSGDCRTAQDARRATFQSHGDRGGRAPTSAARSMASGISPERRRRATRATFSSGRQPEGHSLFRGRRIEAAIEEHRPHRHAASRHVFGERGELAQRLLDTAGLWRDIGARAVALNQKALADEVLHCLAHGDARHVDPRGQIAFRRQRVAGQDGATMHGVLDPALQLQIERTALRQRDRFDAEQCVGSVSHCCSSKVLASTPAGSSPALCITIPIKYQWQP